jgi:hypothetical protein
MKSAARYAARAAVTTMCALTFRAHVVNDAHQWQISGLAHHPNDMRGSLSNINTSGTDGIFGYTGDQLKQCNYLLETGTY